MKIVFDITLKKMKIDVKNAESILTKKLNY